MNLSITKLVPATAEEWDVTSRLCDYATFFHSREWSEIWSAYTGGKTRPHPLAVTFSDGRRALLPLSSRKALKGLTRRFLSSPAGTYGGWISADALRAEHGEALVHWLTHKLGRLEWRVNPYDPLAQQLELPVTTDDQTHAVDLSAGFADVFRAWTKGHSSAAKKAQREGVTVSLAVTEQDWRDYFDVYEDSLRRWGEEATSRYRWELFQEMHGRDSRQIKLWLARWHDRVVAGALCLQARSHVAYWHGAALEEFFGLRPVHLLMHEAMRDTCEKGFAWFDFNPSGRHEGVKAFKKSFGAQALPSAVVRVEENWLKGLRRSFGRLIHRNLRVPAP